MALIRSPSSSCYHCILVVFLCFLGLTSASSSFLSDGIFQSRGASARTLLQATKSCTVDFEHQNYTGLISQCKGPHYPPTPCCGAFKQFACPFSQEINDLTTDCATTMFSYINLYGRFPPGLFANECREGKEGLDCSTVPPAAVSSETVKNSTAHLSANRATFLVAVVSLVTLSQIL